MDTYRLAQLTTLLLHIAYTGKKEALRYSEHERLPASLPVVEPHGCFCHVAWRSAGDQFPVASGAAGWTTRPARSPAVTPAPMEVVHVRCTTEHSVNTTKNSKENWLNMSY